MDWGDCSKIETVPGMENWNTSEVKDMDYMFYVAEAFNGDLSGWNTGKVQDMMRDVLPQLKPSIKISPAGR